MEQLDILKDLLETRLHGNKVVIYGTEFTMKTHCSFSRGELDYCNPETFWGEHVSSKVYLSKLRKYAVNHG